MIRKSKTFAKHPPEGHSSERHSSPLLTSLPSLNCDISIADAASMVLRNVGL